mgnify:FL=1
MEEWKDICGYEGAYKVSTHGNVMSLDRIISYSSGHTQKIIGRILRLSKDKDGYLQIALSKNNTKRTHKAHRLVASAFIKNTENKQSINHIDGIKDNNSVDNLEWATPKENMHHASTFIGLNGPWKGKFGGLNKASKPVIVGGVRYAGIAEAARNINVTPTSVCRAARVGGRVKGMIVSYAISEDLA